MYICTDCKREFECDPIFTLAELCDWSDEEIMELDDYADFELDCMSWSDDRWLEMSHYRLTQNYDNMEDEEYK